MPVVPTREIVERAFAERYGVAAINVVNDLTMEAVLAAAEELRSPLIVQTSVKTVKSIGADALMGMWRAMAAAVDVPVSLHLDHCPERDVITLCLEKGWDSVLFDGSSLSVEENKLQSTEVVAEARTYGALVEGEIEGFKRVEDIGDAQVESEQSLETAVDFISSTGVDIFAPAIGNAHGMYQRAPKLDSQRVTEIVEATGDPRGAPWGDRHVTRPVRGPDRPGLRQGEHLDRSQDPVHAVGLRLHDREPGEIRPALAVRRATQCGHGNGERAHPSVRERGQGLVSALIFDCDGVLADTERDGHRVAFNETFRRLDLPIEWSEEVYGEKLQVAGGKERMATELTPEFAAANRLPTDSEGRAAELAKWHKLKTAIYTDMVASGQLPPRPGVNRLITEAQDAGWLLAVASTSAEPSVMAILRQAVGKERADRFDVVLAGDVVDRKKPAPDIYLLALQRLGVTAGEALVIEDSRNGLLAASAAGLRCVMTVNGYTEEEDNSEAILVVSSLGDPGGERTRVIVNRSSAQPGDYVTLLDLERCLAS